MILDNEILPLQRRVGETATANRAGQARRNGAAKIESSSSFSNIAAEVNSKTSAEVFAAKQPVKETATANFHAWQESDFSFGDFIDIINPLQHLPIVATFYRNWTGDQIGMAPRIIGGALWGRIGGFVTGIVNSVVEAFTGKDIGDHIYAAIFGEPVIKVQTEAAVRTAELKSAPDANPAIAQQEQAPVPVAEIAETPAGPAATNPHANSPLAHEPSLPAPTLSRRAIPPIELVPSRILLHHYWRDEDQSDATNYEKKLRVTA